MKKPVAFAYLSASIFLQGCADLTHLTRTRSNTGRQTTFIDAKQRAIFYDGQSSCAEPSPDALSALAASSSLNISTPEGTTAGGAFALSEAAGSIGLRTQSIQLMRDHMFRLCEAYQSKAIDPITFAMLHRRFQTTMVGILAIEQLTGAIRAPATILGGSSGAGNADAIVKLSATREVQAASLSQAETLVSSAKAERDKSKLAVQNAQTTLSSASSGTTAHADAVTALNTAQSTAETNDKNLIDAQSTFLNRKATLAAIDRSLTLAQASGSASSTGYIETVSHQPGDIAAVADSVQAIVSSTMGLQNTPDFCAIVLSNAVSTSNVIRPDSPVLTMCLQLMGADAQVVQDRIKALIPPPPPSPD